MRLSQAHARLEVKRQDTRQNAEKWDLLKYYIPAVYSGFDRRVIKKPGKSFSKDKRTESQEKFDIGIFVSLLFTSKIKRNNPAVVGPFGLL